jgi:gluconolactonase
MKNFPPKIFAALLLLGASHVKADDLQSLVDPQFMLGRVAGGFKFTEGPVWNPLGFLLFSDIPANTIFEWRPGMARPSAMRVEPTTTPAAIFGGLKVFRTPSGHANGLTFDREGRLIACEHDRRVSRTEKNGSVVSLAEKFEGKRLNSPNDVVVKSDGAIYFTDPPYGLPGGTEGK